LNGQNHAIEVRVDVGVPKSQSTEASTQQDRVPHRVMVDLARIVCMLATIQLNDEPLLEADEIEIESKERRLPTEVKAFGSEQAQLQPKLRFLFRQGFAKFTRSFR
jgi:hypothetical protein